MLLDYNLSTKYQSTNSIDLADALSSLRNVHQNSPEDTFVAAVLVELGIVSVFTSILRPLLVTLQMIQVATEFDPLLQKVIHYHYTK